MAGGRRLVADGAVRPGPDGRAAGRRSSGITPGCRAWGLEYFRARLGQARRDADHALEVTLAYCRTAERQREAVAALTLKCDILWAMLDGMQAAFGGEGAARMSAPRLRPGGPAAAGGQGAAAGRPGPRRGRAAVPRGRAPAQPDGRGRPAPVRRPAGHRDRRRPARAVPGGGRRRRRGRGRRCSAGSATAAWSWRPPRRATDDRPAVRPARRADVPLPAALRVLLQPRGRGGGGGRTGHAGVGAGAGGGRRRWACSTSTSPAASRWRAPDLPALVAAARRAGLYTNLITSGVGLTPGRAAALRDAGLDSVQLSFQADEAAAADAAAGAAAHARKLAAARLVRRLGLAAHAQRRPPPRQHRPRRRDGGPGRGARRGAAGAGERPVRRLGRPGTGRPSSPAARPSPRPGGSRRRPPTGSAAGWRSCSSRPTITAAGRSPASTAGGGGCSR